MKVTLDQVTEWIRTVDDATLDAVLVALHDRHEDLHEARAQRAVLGATVVVFDVTPTCLNGLEGQIVQVDSDEGEVSVRLTQEATGRLRFSAPREMPVGSTQEFVVERVPASCCYDPAAAPWSTPDTA